MTFLKSALPAVPPSEESLLPPEEEIFVPSEAMCKVKARLHTRFSPSPSALSPSSLSKAELVRITGSSAILEWSRLPGFLNWLLNPVYHEEKLEWLEALTFNALEDILLNQDPKAATAKLAAAKLILELRGKIGAKTVSISQTSSSDKITSAVTAMSSDDLLKILEKTKKTPLPSS